jgi:hypothetical protein
MDAAGAPRQSGGEVEGQAGNVSDQLPAVLGGLLRKSLHGAHPTITLNK